MRHPSQTSQQADPVSTLRQFFDREGSGKSSTVQARYARVHQQLLGYLEVAAMGQFLDEGETTRLAVARRTGGGGFFRAFGLEEMICCLGGFVASDWLLPQPVDARAQVSLTGRLIRDLDRSGVLDRLLMGCGLYEAEAAVRAAKGAKGSDAPPVAPTLRLIRGGYED